jgi:hypothetical protein
MPATAHRQTKVEGVGGLVRFVGQYWSWEEVMCGDGAVAAEKYYSYLLLFVDTTTFVSQ